MNILDFLFPRRCVGCGKIGNYFCKKCSLHIQILSENELVCPVCAKSAISGATHPRCQTSFTIDGLTSFFRYSGPIQKAIKLIKYQFVSDLAFDLVKLIPLSRLNQLATQLLNRESLLVPIPLHSSRLRFRGFNQAELLGNLLRQKLDIPMKVDVLWRIRKTIPQVEMKDREKRLNNMKGVFVVNHSALKQLGNKDILLFDDVFTTGATLRTAASVLKRTGIKKVWGLVLAHG